MDYGNSTALILLLARVKPSEECIGRAVEVAAGGLDWEGFFNTSLSHGVAPLIHKNISLLPGVPPYVAELFRKAYLVSLCGSVNASRELREISEVLEDAGIKPVVIKGVINADDVFGDAALYPSADIDILIKQNEVGRLPDIMRLKGYVPEFEPDPFLFDHYAELGFFREGCRTVDFHLGLGDRRYFDIPDEFWLADLRNRSYEGYSYRLLSPEKNLLFAGIHLFEHGYAPLKFIVGIAEMLRAYERDMDWQVLMETAGTFNADKPLLLALFLASTLLDAPLHPAVRARLDECSTMDRWIFHKINRVVFSRVRLSAVMFWLTLMQYNALELLRRMAVWLFPSLREISYRYDLPPGSKKAYCYYLLNPFLLLLKKR